MNGNIASNAANGSNGGGGIALVPGSIYPLNTTITKTSISNNTIPSYSSNNGAGINVVLGNNGSTAVNHVLWIENSTIYANANASSTRIGAVFALKQPQVYKLQLLLKLSVSTIVQLPIIPPLQELVVMGSVLIMAVIIQRLW
jgi:hypothetical protein